FFSSRRRHTRSKRDWSSDVCSSDLRAEARNRSDAWSSFPDEPEARKHGSAEARPVDAIGWPRFRVSPFPRFHPPLTRGLFITIEGPEGAGKTTQARLLYAHLRPSCPVVYTREPSGTARG